MNAGKSLLRFVAMTVPLIVFTCVSLYAGTNHVFYLDSGGHVHQLYSTASGWSDVDVTALSNSPVAASGSALTSSFDHTTNYAHAYYLGTNYHVYELYGTGTAWVSDDATSLAGAPIAVSGSALTSLIDNTNNSSTPHVFYLGTNQHVYELYFTTSWHSDDPTSRAGAAIAASGSSLTSFLLSYESNNVLFTYLDVFYEANQQVYELVGLIGGGNWSYDVPTFLGHGPQATSGSALTSFVDESNITQPVRHVFYLGTNENVYELYDTTAWHSDDPTSLAGGAPIAAAGSALTSFINLSIGDTGMHVMYLGTNQHVYALRWVSGTTWRYFDATAASGGVAAANGSKLTSFQDLAGGVRLYFLGTNSHVYELHWQSEGSASETDLILASGGTVAASGSALTAVVGP